ncbi:MAG TPA: cupin domain-containing protein [Acidimicrobiales bacterium]|nr:cupin domain-containing protein [Acidimicrobiales bacterium]
MTTRLVDDWTFLGVRIRQLSAPREPMVVAEVWLPEGASPPLHVHEGLDDSFYVLEGTMVVRCGDEVTVAGSGTWVPFPSGVPHTFRVMRGPAWALQVHADDSFMQFVRAVGRPTRAGDEPTTAGGPDPDELSRLMAAHGMRAVGDPMEVDEAEGWMQRLAPWRFTGLRRSRGWLP